MYSRPQTVPQYNSIWLLYVNDTIYRHTNFSIWQEDAIFKTAKMYHYLEQNNLEDPFIVNTQHTFRHFPESFKKYAVQCINNSKDKTITYKSWLSAYIENTTKKQFNSIEFKEVELNLNNTHYQTTTEHTILKIK